VKDFFLRDGVVDFEQRGDASCINVFVERVVAGEVAGEVVEVVYVEIGYFP
jgi:hypothetical protein